jgi:hypothetical protein
LQDQPKAFASTCRERDIALLEVVLILRHSVDIETVGSGRGAGVLDREQQHALVAQRRLSCFRLDR